MRAVNTSKFYRLLCINDLVYWSKASGYASDISRFDVLPAYPCLKTGTWARTFPVSGKFSTAQTELYSAVLTVQKELIRDCTESAGYALHELHQKSCIRLKEELTRLGFHFKSTILGGDTDFERMLYPHFLGHPIGIGKLNPWADPPNSLSKSDLHESSNVCRRNR